MSGEPGLTGDPPLGDPLLGALASLEVGDRAVFFCTSASRRKDGLTPQPAAVPGTVLSTSGEPGVEVLFDCLPDVFGGPEHGPDTRKGGIVYQEIEDEFGEPVVMAFVPPYPADPDARVQAIALNNVSPADMSVGSG